MSITSSYPAAEVVAAARAREPGAVLLFRCPGRRYGAQGPADVAIVEEYLRGVAPFTTYLAKGIPAWLSFDSSHLGPLLSRLAAEGIVAVCDPIPEEPVSCP